MLPWCRTVPRWIPTVGDWGATSPCPHSKYVCTCCQVVAEGGRKADSPQLLVWSPRAGPWGGCLSHPACGISDFPRGRSGAYSMKCTCLKGCLAYCPLDPKWMEEATRDILSSLRSCLRERTGIHRLEEDLWGATVPIPQPSHQTEPHPQIQGGMTFLIRPSRKPGSAPTGVGGCPHFRTEHWKTELGSRQNQMLVTPQLQPLLG